MYVILDTNIIYYWSGKQVSAFDPIKIGEELNKFDEIFVPFWSVIEIITSSELSRNDIKEIFLFLGEKKVPIPAMTNEGARLIPPNIIDLIDTPAFDQILKSCLDFKFDIELSLLNYMLESFIAIMGIFYDKKVDLKTDDNRHKFTIQLQSLILGNRDFINKELSLILKEFYRTKNESKFKENFQGLAFSLLFIVSHNFNSALFGKFLTDFKKEETITDADILKIQQSISTDRYFKKILKKMNEIEQREILKIPEDNKEIEDALQEFIKEMSRIYSPSMVKYISILMKKFFTDGIKITKNDMIDSQLFTFDLNYLKLSAEKKVKRIYEEINPSIAMILLIKSKKHSPAFNYGLPHHFETRPRLVCDTFLLSLPFPLLTQVAC